MKQTYKKPILVKVPVRLQAVAAVSRATGLDTNGIEPQGQGNGGQITQGQGAPE